MQGAISPVFIADAIAKHSSKTNIGAHDIFLGQVRADLIENKLVQAIEYSCYESMAEDTFHQIREAAFGKFTITCMHIYHNIGVLKPERSACLSLCRQGIEQKHLKLVVGL